MKLCLFSAMQALGILLGLCCAMPAPASHSTIRARYPALALQRTNTTSWSAVLFTKCVQRRGELHTKKPCKKQAQSPARFEPAGGAAGRALHNTALRVRERRLNVYTQWHAVWHTTCLGVVAQLAWPGAARKTVQLVGQRRIGRPP